MIERRAHELYRDLLSYFILPVLVAIMCFISYRVYGTCQQCDDIKQQFTDQTLQNTQKFQDINEIHAVINNRFQKLDDKITRVDDKCNNIDKNVSLILGKLSK